MTKQSFLEKRSTVATFGILALIGGFVFLNTGSSINPFTGRVTGNSVLGNFQPFSLISIIGLLLILCSGILIAYSIVKKS